ncbi:MAG: EcsC family protein [Candidatus Acididesulfobacter guangdongensis]|uniref:EcsC family protein n=1 Tax=Acididesulfobacter guangdongensis TaxID=2597225 RepID=A0A519BFH1_ACIG2|nr:MAG: EcsC family protein [Candidatus Acididesulfobacter guangdongensis]
MEITNSDLVILEKSKNVLENPDFIMQVIDKLGQPIDSLMKRLPDNYRDLVGEAIQKALLASLKVAMGTMDLNNKETSSFWHKIATTGLGAIGGVFGLPGFLVEFPISTTVMMRSILDIANSCGEDLTKHEVQLECLLIFALGGGNYQNNNANCSNYFSKRFALASSVRLAAQYIAENTVIDESAPVIVRLIASIAEFFGVDVTIDAAASAVPIIGAIGGGTINYLFIDQFQKLAGAHFTIKKLERIYGVDYIYKKYNSI